MKHIFKIFLHKQHLLKHFCINLNLCKVGNGINTLLEKYFKILTVYLKYYKFLQSLEFIIDVNRDIILTKNERLNFLKLIEVIGAFKSLQKLSFRMEPIVILTLNDHDFFRRWGFAITSLTNLRSLKIDFPSMDHTILLSRFSKLEKLKYLEININMPKKECFANIFQNLLNLNTLNFDLSKNRFNTEKFLQLFVQVPQKSKFKNLYLDFSFNKGNISNFFLEQMILLLKFFNKLKSFAIDLSNNMLNNGTLELFSNALVNFTNLKTLKVAYTGLENELCESDLSHFIKQLPPKLVTLHLNFENSKPIIKGEIIDSLANYIKKKDLFLKDLYLNFRLSSAFNNTDFDCLTLAINSKLDLENLSLDFSYGHNTFKTREVQLFFRGLSNKYYMKILQLNFRKLPELCNYDICLCLSQSLSNMKSLKLFDLIIDENNMKSWEKTQAIGKILKVLSTLPQVEEIDLQLISKCETEYFEEEIHKKLIYCLTSLKNLKKLRIFCSQKNNLIWRKCFELANKLGVELILLKS